MTYPSRRNEREPRAKKFCRMCADKTEKVDYRDTQILDKFTNDRGKILPRKATGLCAKHQKMVSKAIKNARTMALLPFIDASMR